MFRWILKKFLCEWRESVEQKSWKKLDDFDHRERSEKRKFNLWNNNIFPIIIRGSMNFFTSKLFFVFIWNFHQRMGGKEKRSKNNLLIFTVRNGSLYYTKGLFSSDDTSRFGFSGIDETQRDIYIELKSWQNDKLANYKLNVRFLHFSYSVP